MTPTFGIQETKELLRFVLALGNAAGQAARDGKIDVSDLAYFVSALTKIGPALDKIDLVPKELADLSEAEREELLAFFRSEFDIPQDRLEAIIELLFSITLSFARLLAMLKR